MGRGSIRRAFAGIALVAAAFLPTAAGAQSLEAQFDSTLGTKVRAPTVYQAVYSSDLERRIAALADGGRGRIGVAAVDLASGYTVSVLGDQPFPMASTSKIAIAATFLDGVEHGRWSLSSSYPLMIPVKSVPFAGARAPVRPGTYMTAATLIERMITRSDNTATDALLAVIGGPPAVNAWLAKARIEGAHIDRDIATLVRDDGEFDPATHIDRRDAATPLAMVELLSGLYQGKWLTAESRRVIIGAMERCRTGKRRMVALMPAGVSVAHKTGSLNNTSSDIGIIRTADGRAIAVAIYVTGQGTRLNRESRIASIARAVHDGYVAQPTSHWVNARYASVSPTP